MYAHKRRRRPGLPLNPLRTISSVLQSIKRPIHERPTETETHARTKTPSKQNERNKMFRSFANLEKSKTLIRPRALPSGAEQTYRSSGPISGMSPQHGDPPDFPCSTQS